MEETKWLKPSISVSRIGDSASVQAVTRVKPSRPCMGHFLSTLISILCSCYFKWDNKAVRGELAIGREVSRHNLVFGRSIAT